MQIEHYTKLLVLVSSPTVSGMVLVRSYLLPVFVCNTFLNPNFAKVLCCLLAVVLFPLSVVHKKPRPG